MRSSTRRALRLETLRILGPITRDAETGGTRPYLINSMVMGPYFPSHSLYLISVEKPSKPSKPIKC